MILVECKPDELLIRKLKPSIGKRGVVHSHNKSGVIQRLTDADYANCIGMVDEDPGKTTTRVINNFTNLNNHNAQSILEKEYPSNSTKLIILRPRLEEWILNACRLANIKPRDYKLPPNGDSFHSMINGNLDKYEKLLDDLIPVSLNLQFLSSLL